MKTNQKTRVGVVFSRKMNKTAVVIVERRAMDPMFKKVIRRVKKFKVHDEKNQTHPGDLVEIIETRPLSKDKCWTLQKILKKADHFEADQVVLAEAVK